jgi:hypothetical protein
VARKRSIEEVRIQRKEREAYMLDNREYLYCTEFFPELYPRQLND